MRPTSTSSDDGVDAAEQKHNQEWRDGGVAPSQEDQVIALAAAYVPTLHPPKLP